MLYEERLRSMKRLLIEAEKIEVDEGIRAVSRYKGKRYILFVTKNGSKYNAVLFPLRGKRRMKIVNEPAEFREFNDFRELATFLYSVVERPVTAYVY